MFAINAENKRKELLWKNVDQIWKAVIVDLEIK